MVAHNYADAEIARLIRHEAVAFRSRHPRFDLDDLMSVAGEAFAEALARLDPGLDRDRHWNTIKTTIRSRLKDHARSERVPGRSCARLPADEDGNELPVEDRRAADPCARAAAREILLPPGAGKVVAPLPGPSEAARRVELLREVMFQAIAPEQVNSMMQKLMTAAAAGDPAATRSVIRLLGAAAPAAAASFVNVNLSDF